MNPRIKQIILVAIAIVAAAFLLLQLVPYGRAHTNPQVVNEPAWDRPATRELAQRACFDCHSNQTTWPWYSNIAPVSWLVQRDVDEGRAVLNFSEWGLGGEGDEMDELNEVIAEGEMPPAQFLITHPEARLTPAEKEALITGLLATTGSITMGERGETEDGDDD